MVKKSLEEIKMTKKIRKNLRKYLAAGALALATIIPISGNAQSIFNGLRGPTVFQVDNRVSYSTKEAQTGIRTQIPANNLILKYWDGAENGIFAFVNLPYKNIKSGNIESEGIGDILLGIGPRFERKLGENKLGLLTYFGTVLPTGDKSAKLALGTGRSDSKVGLFGTLLSASKKYEADVHLDYTLTEGKEVSDNIHVGIVLGGRINDNLRLVAGPRFIYKSGGNNDGESALSGRVDARYTPPGKLGKKMHFELWYDRSLEIRGASPVKNRSALTLVGRYSF